MLINFKTIVDERGNLCFAETAKEIPFEIKRIYWLYGLNEKPRGFHAHKNLMQVAICIAGSCTILLDDGKKKEEVLLSKANQGLVIGKMIWHEMHSFSKDAILLLLASDYYIEDDYIRNYDEFVKECNKA
jgi:dTDP-4-dehydrorhamnose 3,5-epimerase-like enzyme